MYYPGYENVEFEKEIPSGLDIKDIKDILDRKDLVKFIKKLNLKMKEI